MSSFFISSLETERDDYLSYSNNIIKAEKIIKKEGGTGHHMIWHVVYIGFGFLNNPYKIEYYDSVAIAKAKLIQPNVVLFTNQYESLLKNEVINILKTDPGFVAKTIFAKSGVVILFLLVFSNIGIIYIFKSLRNLTFTIPIIVCLIFNFSFPLLAYPWMNFSLGTICTVVVWSVISMDLVRK